MAMLEFPKREGHDGMCILNFGFARPGDEKRCDCGVYAAQKRREEEEKRIAAIRNCSHQFVGFRTAKLCKHCDKTKVEIKELSL